MIGLLRPASNIYLESASLASTSAPTMSPTGKQNQGSKSFQNRRSSARFVLRKNHDALEVWSGEFFKDVVGRIVVV
jgi:hypothetical protein